MQYKKFFQKLSLKHLYLIIIFLLCTNCFLLGYKIGQQKIKITNQKAYATSQPTQPPQPTPTSQPTQPSQLLQPILQQKPNFQPTPKIKPKPKPRHKTLKNNTFTLLTSQPTPQPTTPQPTAPQLTTFQLTTQTNSQPKPEHNPNPQPKPELNELKKPLSILHGILFTNEGHFIILE